MRVCASLRDSAIKRAAPSSLYVLAVLLCLGYCLSFATNVAAEKKKNSPHVNYMLHCQGCHLPEGIGHPGLVPKLKGNVGKFLSVEGGRAYLVQVPGSAQSTLSDAELAEVLNWIVPTFDPEHTPASFKAFSAEEVSRYRSVRIRNVTQIRTELLSEFSYD